MEKKGQEYICPRCTTTRKQSQLQPEPQLHLQPDPELGLPESLKTPGEEGKGDKEPQASKVRNGIVLLLLAAFSQCKLL